MEEQNEKRIGEQEEQESIWSDADQSESVWRGQSAAPPPLSRPMQEPEPELRQAAGSRPEPEPRQAAESRPEPEPRRASESQQEPEPRWSSESQPEPEPKRTAESQPKSASESQPKRASEFQPGPNDRPIHPSSAPYRPDQSGPRTVRRQNDMAVAALVMGILSLVGSCCAWGGVAFGALGILFALLSRGDEPMEGKAKTGMLLSILGIALGFLAVLALLMFGIAA